MLSPPRPPPKQTGIYFMPTLLARGKKDPEQVRNSLREPEPHSLALTVGCHLIAC